jgi:hypothetical protein
MESDSHGPGPMSHRNFLDEGPLAQGQVSALRVAAFHRIKEPIGVAKSGGFMRSLLRMGLFFSATVVAFILFSSDAQAQYRGRGGGVSLGGDMSLGLGISTVSASQDGVNGAIDDATNNNGANIKSLGSALEFYANWGIRFSGTTYALIFRPSYFTQSTDGSNSTQSFKYDLSGYTIYPLFRLYALENSFIRFFMQAGVGYGSLSGKITAGSSNVDFKGSAFGALGGIGVDFCFTASHCLSIEGNLRYMPIERNLVSGGNCTGSSQIPGVSQCSSGSELERKGSDLSTTMSGVQGLIGYTMNF